jgi:hypothetical protein
MPLWNVAGTPQLVDCFRAAQTLDVQVCSANLATVDTTILTLDNLVLLA